MRADKTQRSHRFRGGETQESPRCSTALRAHRSVDKGRSDTVTKCLRLINAVLLHTTWCVFNPIANLCSGAKDNERRQHAKRRSLIGKKQMDMEERDRPIERAEHGQNAS